MMTVLTAHMHHALIISNLAIVDENNDPIDMSAINREFTVWRRGTPGTILKTIAHGDISVSGDDSNLLSLTVPEDPFTIVEDLSYIVRNTSNDSVVFEGAIDVKEAPDAP